MITARPDGLGRRALAPQLLLGALFVVFMLSVPWVEIRGGFIDLYRYQLNFSQNVYRLEFSDSLFGLWQNEILWRWMVRTLAAANDGFAEALGLVSAAAVTLTCAYVVLNTRRALYLIVLVSPLYVDLVFSQVRSAIAIALLYLGLMLFRRHATRLLAPLCVLLATFMHNFAIVLSGLAGGFYAVRALRLRPRTAIVLCLAIIVVVICFMTVLRNDVLQAIGDRRMFAYQKLSGVGITLLVFSISLPAWLRFKEIATDVHVYIVIAAALLHAAFYVTGFVAGPRIVAMALPAIAVALSAIRSSRLRNGALLYILLCNAAYFAVWARNL